jgi:hypothetical protein
MHHSGSYAPLSEKAEAAAGKHISAIAAHTTNIDIVDVTFK